MDVVVAIEILLQHLGEAHVQKMFLCCKDLEKELVLQHQLKHCRKKNFLKKSWPTSAVYAVLYGLVL